MTRRTLIKAPGQRPPHASIPRELACDLHMLISGWRSRCCVKLRLASTSRDGSKFAARDAAACMSAALPPRCAPGTGADARSGHWAASHFSHKLGYKRDASSETSSPRGHAYPTLVSRVPSVSHIICAAAGSNRPRAACLQVHLYKSVCACYPPGSAPTSFLATSLLEDTVSAADTGHDAYDRCCASSFTPRGQV